MTLCTKCEREAVAMTSKGPMCVEHEMKHYDETGEEGRYERDIPTA